MDFKSFMADAPALKRAIETRHSVRQYRDEPLPKDATASLQQALDILNEDHWLDLQLVQDEPRAFDCFTAKQMKFTGVRNYIALVGPECKELSEVLGYAGEKLVLFAQVLGLNTCWVGGTYKMVNRAYRVEIATKLEGVIALGYGQTQGEPHRSVSPESVSRNYASAPEWFQQGVHSALLAPTAMNQQKFRFDMMGGVDAPLVKAHTKRGPFSKMSLGIAKLHFEIGAGPDSFEWA